MINDKISPLPLLLDCTIAKRCSDTNCMDVEMSVVNDEKHVSSNINSCIDFVKSKNIQVIISNKLDNKFILKTIHFNNNSQLHTIAKCSNDYSKTIDNLEIEPMDLESIMSDKRTNAIVEKLDVKEKNVVISKIKLSDTYGIFPTDVSPLS